MLFDFPCLLVDCAVIVPDFVVQNANNSAKPENSNEWIDARSSEAKQFMCIIIYNPQEPSRYHDCLNRLIFLPIYNFKSFFFPSTSSPRCAPTLRHISLNANFPDYAPYSLNDSGCVRRGISLHCSGRRICSAPLPWVQGNSLRVDEPPDVCNLTRRGLWPGSQSDNGT